MSDDELNIKAIVEKREIEKYSAEYFKIAGSKGGKSRAKKHSKKQLSEWSKKGGRPKKI